MVNPLRPEQVRVLGRIKMKEIATTIVTPHATEDNFLGVRTALGMSASDSLLFAPITVITEGETEVACLPFLIKKLENSSIVELSDMKKLLGLASFLSGTGDAFEYLCRLAKASGVLPILFLDGDKRARVAQARIQETHTDVPIVFLPGRSEFEELVSAKTYLRAVFAVTGLEIPADAENQLQLWTAEKPRREHLGFSKRVEQWFGENYDEILPGKRERMQKALELATLDEINTSPIIELLGEIRKRLSETSFA